eukprot:TRINITY_DN1544_c0_g1_i1.p3 TRINITY_DN1544_c0_g1~~TRINITY_DN1544_c0_g1_i1.p3  ORF type:complete len:122 (+),score=26.17 TRINITY_DN1544_c0_g1_i1:516-881(+)
MPLLQCDKHCPDMLVIPKRIAPTVADLSVHEFTELWALAKRVSEVVQQQYSATSFTFAIQDGPDAGQTVRHVHIHIIPRREGDFAFNDLVYQELESPPPERKPRDRKEMVAEAQRLKPFFC